MAQEIVAPVEQAEAVADERDTIVVVASRISGQIDTDIPPIMTLDEADITAYGAASIGDLLQAISPQTGSGRGRGGGRPVVLLNGQRISNFRQLRDIPPEAIRRMEVLPEEVALRFGYAPDQRVVNFILKDNFSSIQVDLEYKLPTRGGFEVRELETGFVKFSKASRLNLNYGLIDESLLTEVKRDIVASPGEQPSLDSDPDPLAFRSLIDDSVLHTLTGTWSTGLGKDGFDGSLAFDGELRRRDARALLGLDTVVLTAPGGASALRTVPGEIERDVRSDAIEGGITLNKPLGDWQLTATADAVQTETTTRTDRRADLSGLVNGAAAGQLAVNAALTIPPDPGRDRARNKLFTLSTFAGIAGSPLRLPAGPASLSADLGYDRLDNRASDTRSALGQTKLTRDIFKVGANLALPITGGREDFADAVGDITFNLSGDLHDFSDFGTLTDRSAGLVWSPWDKLSFNASYIVSEVAPSIGQLGNPRIETFNVPVFDFATGQNALVSVITGGNPGLLAEKQRDIKLSVNQEIDLFDRSSLIVEYFRNGSDNVTRNFPLLTPDVEAAFPDRVRRDAAGRLLSIDRRPITLDRVETERLRWGINISGKVGRAAERGGERAAGPAAPPAPKSPAEAGPPPFDPQRFGQIRAALCGNAPPDPAALPEPMRARLTGADGKIDPARLEQLRARMCGSEGPPAGFAPPAGFPPGAGPAGGRTPGGGSGGMGGGGMMPFGRGGPNDGRWNLSVYHTWQFADTVRIGPSSAVLDQLEGNSLLVGGVPRHSIEVEGGVFSKGLGLRFNASWTAPARVLGSGGPGSTDLRFGSVLDIGGRIFVNLGMMPNLVEKSPFLKGMRIAFEFDNLLNSRQKVTDSTGEVPFAYQAAFLDPRGRVLGIDIRKSF